MKRLFKLSAVLLCLCFVCSSFSVMPVLAAPKVIVDDNFDNYKIGDIPEGWDISASNKDDGTWGEIEEDPDQRGNKVLAVHATGAQRNYAPIGGHITYKFRMRLPEVRNECMYLACMWDCHRNLTYQDSWNLWNGKQQFVLPNMKVEYNRWYEMEIVLNFDEHTYDVVCDGQTWVEGFVFDNVDAETINFISWSTPAGVMYLDDLQITQEGEAKKVYTKLSSAQYVINSINQTVKNIDFETTVDEFLSKMTFTEGAVTKVTNPDGTPYTGRFLQNNLLLSVSSPEGDQHKNFVLQARPWMASLITVDYAKDAIILAKDSNDAIIKGRKQYISSTDLGVKPFEQDGKTYVPLRFVAEKLGHEVTWIAAENAVSFAGVKLVQSTSTVTKNSQPLNVEGKTINKDGTIYVPVEWITEMFDIQVRTHENVIIIKGDVSFADARMEKLALSEIVKRYK